MGFGDTHPVTTCDSLGTPYPLHPKPPILVLEKPISYHGTCIHTASIKVSHSRPLAYPRTGAMAVAPHLIKNQQSQTADHRFCEEGLGAHAAVLCGQLGTRQGCPEGSHSVCALGGLWLWSPLAREVWRGLRWDLSNVGAQTGRHGVRTRQSPAGSRPSNAICLFSVFSSSMKHRFIFIVRLRGDGDESWAGTCWSSASEPWGCWNIVPGWI